MDETEIRKQELKLKIEKEEIIMEHRRILQSIQSIHNQLNNHQNLGFDAEFVEQLRQTVELIEQKAEDLDERYISAKNDLSTFYKLMNDYEK